LKTPTKCFFGFYYGGNVQFLCPYESFINAQIVNDVPELSYEKKLVTGFGFGQTGLETVGVGSVSMPRLKKASAYRLLISYFDEAGNICEFKLGVNCKRLYTLYEYGDTRKADVMESVQSDFAREKLAEILTRLNAYPALAQRIAEGKLAVREINGAWLQKILEKATREEIEYENQLEEEAVANNKAHARFRLFILGAIAAIGVLILMGKGLSLLADTIHVNQKNKAAAAPIVHLIDSIGEVTLDDKDTIARVEEAYGNLTDAQREYVKNYDTFREAKAQFTPMYTEYMNELTKDDPTRGITIDDLWGTWVCGDQYVQIGSYNDYVAVVTGTNIQELRNGASKRSVIPTTTFSGAYDCLTQTKRGRFTHVFSNGADIYVNRHDFSVFINENGVLTMQLGGYTFTRNAR